MAAIATLTLAACGPTTSTPPPAEETASGGDAHVALYQQPAGFNTLKPGIGGDELIESLHFDTLIGWNLETSDYESRLAESWEVSEDGTKVTFDLIPDLKWSDGEPFTAEDVVFTYNLHANPAATSSTAGFLTNVVGNAEVKAGTADTLSGLVAEDADTVSFSLVTPDATFLGNFLPGAFNFGWILPKHALEDMDPAGMLENEWFREPTAGMGPYVFSKWVSDSQLEFVANPEFRSELKLDRVFASTLTSDAAQAQLQTGELHLSSVPAVDVETVRSIAGITVESAPGAGVLALHTAMDTHPELADPLVRQAMLYAIDRQGIIDEVFHGEGTVVNVLAHGPEWAVPSGLEEYAYDPEKAKELLAEANWDASREVTLEIVPGQKDRDLTLDIVAAQLKAVGMNAVVRQLDAASQTAAIGARDFQLLISGYGNFVVDPSSMNIRLMCGVATNIQAYCNPELDALLTKGLSEPDQAEREKIYAEAQQIVNEEVPMILLSSPTVIFGVSDKLQGFEPRRLLTDAFYSAPNWSITG
ncbi:hypothetical protein ASD65_10390 [Microbacterium sp. Root61]|uniref:ABC transporter substrate-binding protein n=1 Tax=Microbacterium sp. Root61 TaxID=1736570 RepID=UPI0006FA5840|nr:ABC transporter substrate-binding protein [Microbacterium sp. Root61]KRA24785.1 hypothetical protein ASD65_10390 [Microbacterium sp. Root61]